jgi:hypothetical protein
MPQPFCVRYSSTVFTIVMHGNLYNNPLASLLCMGTCCGPLSDYNSISHCRTRHPKAGPINPCCRGRAAYLRPCMLATPPAGWETLL